MSTTLKLSREGVGIELRRGTFDVEIDGARVGSIEWHETKEFAIEPGHHTVQLRAGRYQSRAKAFDARDESVVSFRCHGAMMWPRWLVSALKPSLAISLAREWAAWLRAPAASRMGVTLRAMTHAERSDPADPIPGAPEESTGAQFGPHRFYAGEGGGSEQFRGARFDVADLRGARFTDCDMTGVRIRDGWLVDVGVSGHISNFTVNGVDVTDFVSAELDRRHPERVQLREGRDADDVRAIWDTIERLWGEAVERAGRLPRAALAEQVDEEWSFQQTLRHLIFITDAWASRTVLDEPMPYHPIGVPQSWYPPADAAALGIDDTAQPEYAEILAVRADRMAVVRRIVEGLTDEELGRTCRRSPAPGYPDEERSVIECIAVVMEEEIEHYRFAVRDLAVLEGVGSRSDRPE
jgi:hypothetical protein